MKREGKKVKKWLAGLLGAFLIGMLGACGGETESEPTDRNIPVTAEVTGELENVSVCEKVELIAEVSPTVESEVPKGLVTEPTPAPTSTPEPTPEPTATPAPTPELTIEPVIERAPMGTDYILNTNTKKFHYTDCRSVKQMKEKNKKYYTGTRDECISMGYDPCGNCEP